MSAYNVRYLCREFLLTARYSYVRRMKQLSKVKLAQKEEEDS